MKSPSYLHPTGWRALATAACLSLYCGGLTEGATSPTDQEVKVAFLYQFARFIEWPAGGEARGAPFVVAVLGSDQFWALAERKLSGRNLGDSPWAVRRISEPTEALTARILFIGESEAERLPAILGVVDGSSVLTIGDLAGFAERGGMIGFRTEEKRVRFDINVEQVGRARLRISSQVLKLARVVRTREQK